MDLSSHLSMSHSYFLCWETDISRDSPSAGAACLFSLVGHIYRHGKEPDYSAWVMSREVDVMFFLKYNILSHTILLRIEIYYIKIGAHIV